MKIAVFGGTGFIGTNLSIFLQENGAHDVYLFDNFLMTPQNSAARVVFPVTQGDMCNFDEVNRFIKKVKPERIYHFAANSDIQASQSNSQLDIKHTFMSTEILSQVLSFNSVREVVFASSSAVYGPKNGKIKESDSCNPISSYGWMKLASENTLKSLAKRDVVEKLLIARFPNVTGKWQTHGVVFDLINRLKKNPKYLKVLGNGTQSKPYLLASELVKVISDIISLENNTDYVVNIAPQNNLTVMEIVELILEISSLNPDIHYDSHDFGWIGDVPKYELETGKLHDLLPNIQLTDSLPAIRIAIEWMWNKYGN